MIGNRVERYSSGAILLHWLIAFALAAELALGFAMPKDASGFVLYQLHKSIGITILVLSLLRLVWRLTHNRPPAMEGGFTGFLASAVHVLFYAFMILMPLTGWAIVSSAEIEVPTLLYGLVPWPHLPVAQSLNHTFEETHELLAFGGIGLFLLHVAGALRHHFMIGDRLLSRIAPGGQPVWTLALGAGVVAAGLGLLFAIGPSGGHDHDDHDDDAAPVEEVAVPQADAAVEEELIAEEAVAEDAEAEEEEQVVEEAEEVAEEAVAEQPAPAGPPPQWTILPGGSLRFSVANGDMRMNGSFSQWGGRIDFDPDHPETADIAIDIQLASATLGDATQDQMVRGGDFLAAAANPVARWRATSVTALGEGRYRANGTLSLKGVSRPQALTFTLTGEGNRRSVTGRAVIDRNAFGVGTGDAAANLGGEVTVNFAFDASS